MIRTVPGMLAGLVLLAGCTSSGSPPTSGGTSTVVTTRTITPPASASTPAGSDPTASGSPTPVATGPTTTSRGTCPLVTSDFVANAVGMRLGKVTVQRSSGRVVGCRVYALQGSPLSTSEHLPGPDQPVVEVVLTRYASATDATAAVSATASAGANGQRTGDVSCFQTAFYAPDAGKDWACGFAQGNDMVLVRTVVTSPALNALRVTQQVRRGL